MILRAKVAKHGDQSPFRMCEQSGFTVFALIQTSYCCERRNDGALTGQLSRIVKRKEASGNNEVKLMMSLGMNKWPETINSYWNEMVLHAKWESTPIMFSNPVCVCFIVLSLMHWKTLEITNFIWEHSNPILSFGDSTPNSSKHIGYKIFCWFSSLFVLELIFH